VSSPDNSQLNRAQRLWALVPVKGFGEGKQRLAGVLNAGEREALCRAMLGDVLDALCGHPRVDQVLLVSDDLAVAQIAHQRAILCWTEADLAARGLNAAVNAAARRLQGDGVATLMVVHGDLPELDIDAVERLVSHHDMQPSPAVTVAPDRHGEGSNIVMASPPAAIAFQFGPRSFQQHSAPVAGVAVTAFFCQDSCADIDTPADLQDLIRRRPADKHSLDYLLRSGIAARLAGDERETASRGQQ